MTIGTGSDEVTNAASHPQTSRADDSDTVTLSVPAHPSYVSVLRTVTASMAARRDFTIEEIDDLRIAVDEASALLLAGGDAGSSDVSGAPGPDREPDLPDTSSQTGSDLGHELALIAEFGGTNGVLSVTVSVPLATSTAHLPPLDQNSFAWMVLTALADEVVADDGDGHRSITLTKNRLPRS